MMPDTHGVAVRDTFNDIVACIDMDPEEITYNALLASVAVSPTSSDRPYSKPDLMKARYN
jgi:hypothetical protein